MVRQVIARNLLLLSWLLTTATAASSLRPGDTAKDAADWGRTNNDNNSDNDDTNNKDDDEMSLDQTSVYQASGYCRPAQFPPHQASTWQEGFPHDMDKLPVGVCDGTITIREDGSMCVEGKVNYNQLQEASGDDRPIYQLTAGEISINGHMIGGSGYVWLGPEVRYLYDFITSYTVNGVEYPNDSRINDNALAASRGSIDGVCLSPEFRTKERFYKISHSTFFTGRSPLDMEVIKAGSYIFISRYFTVIEYHTWQESKFFLDPGVLTYSITNLLTDFFNFASMPDI